MNFGGEWYSPTIGLRPLFYNFREGHGILNNGKDGTTEEKAYALVLT